MSFKVKSVVKTELSSVDLRDESIFSAKNDIDSIIGVPDGVFNIRLESAGELEMNLLRLQLIEDF